MDPNANLRELRALASDIIDSNDRDDGGTIDVVDCCRLAELAQALDEWLTKGGALPSDWTRSRATALPSDRER